MQIITPTEARVREKLAGYVIKTLGLARIGMAVAPEGQLRTKYADIAELLQQINDMLEKSPNAKIFRFPGRGK